MSEDLKAAEQKVLKAARRTCAMIVLDEDGKLLPLRALHIALNELQEAVTAHGELLKPMGK